MERENLVLIEIATFIMIFFPPLGGAFYIAGSVVYWPSLTNVNPAAGGLLFTIGSVLLVLNDFATSYIQPEFNMFRPLRNIGAFRALCLFIGNLAFTIGSVYFIPNLPVIVGQDLFLIGSVFQFIPQILCVWGITSLNPFTAQFYIKMVKFKKTLVYINLCLAGGCFCFFIGTYLFENLDQQSYALDEEAVLLFIIGSIFYLIAPLMGLKMRKVRILDPLSKYHDEMHHHYLPKTKQLLDNIHFKETKTFEQQFIVLSRQPSIIVTVS